MDATANKCNPEKYCIGVDAGSVSLNAVVINDSREVVFESPYVRHFGRLNEEVYKLIYKLFSKFDASDIESIGFTGIHGQALGEKLGVFYEFETISQVLGVLALIPEVRSIISMGGQDSALFQIGHGSDGWELQHFSTNGPCASGTGSFIDQQAERLATSQYEKSKNISQRQIDRVLDDFIQLGLKSKNPANVACRCTVFTKSDMIHLQNKGERLEDIIYGLHVGNARNYISTIVSSRNLEDPVAFVGGLSLNALQVKALKRYFPKLVVPPLSTSTGALGVALKALESKDGNEFSLDRLKMACLDGNINVSRAPKLQVRKTRIPAGKTILKKAIIKKTGVYLGIDIGSTTTKYVLIDDDQVLIDKQYVLTRGKPIEVTQGLLAGIRNKFEDKVEILGAVTTGSGRNVVGDFLNSDLIVDEISAHARGAVKINPLVDTIFEIGGQDSKYIHIVDTHPLDFDMNKVCAAGTGSFLHELASKYGINIVDEFQKMALGSDAPVKLAERCTVFMESDLVSLYQKGVPRKDLLAGLCYAIVHNYLNRVVGKRYIGRRVMFIGGPSLNKAVVAAFEIVLGRRLIVPPNREVLGAYGAAVMLQDKFKSGGNNPINRRNLEFIIKDRLNYKEKTCRTDPNCHNQCKLKIYDFGNRSSVWGGECGRYELTRRSTQQRKNFFKLRQMLWEQHLDGAYDVLGAEPLMEVDGRPTVGMQSALYGHQTGILWAHFFDYLGYRLVFTQPTNARISKRGIEHSEDGVCFPVKVSHGHIKELAGKTRYLFIPSLLNMPTPKASETGRFCPMVMSNGYMVRMTLNLNKSAILNPALHLKNSPEALAEEITVQMKSKLGHRKALYKAALYHALEKQRNFENDLRQKGKKILADRNDDEPLIVVTGRSYNLYDERLNLWLGRNLSRIGIEALPMDFIDVRSVDLSDFSSMYWGLGTQILRTARWIKTAPHVFGLHLTNFGCGADSFLEHFYKHIMGHEAYLILELDEHSAMAGVMTRLEAFKNVIESSMVEKMSYQSIAV